MLMGYKSTKRAQAAFEKVCGGEKGTKTERRNAKKKLKQDTALLNMRCLVLAPSIAIGAKAVGHAAQQGRQTPQQH